MFQASSSGKNKGVSAFIALAVMTTLLLMVFGLVSIISPQIKMTAEIGKSVIAFHAADSGIERLAEAIYVGYDRYEYQAHGECIEVDIGEEETKKVCDFTNCTPSITFNAGGDCGLPSKCDINDDCICPTDKCIGYNYYDYPLTGACSGGKCICDPTINVNNQIPCGYYPEMMDCCDTDSDCPCPISKCRGLELDAVMDIYPSGWETPYYDTLPNGATYKTYIISSNSIKSIGIYKGVNRAIEVSF